MPFGFGHHEDASALPAHGITATALVTATEEPLENLFSSNSDELAKTQVLMNVGTGSVVGYRGLPLDVDHWVTVGQSVPVIVDPANPNGYAIDWAQTPGITERIESNDPSLVDPMGARLRVWDALAAAGYHEPDLDQVAPQTLQREMTELRAQLVAEPQSFARQLAGVSSLPAPDGYQRALVQIVTSTALWGTKTHTQVKRRQTLGTHSVVLSIAVPGALPYAVFVRSFDHQARQYDEYNPGLPAVVSTTDPTDVRVLWDELAKIGQPLPETGAQPVDPTAAQHPVPTGAKAMMTEQAIEMVRRLPPESRPAIIAYYKTMGIEVDPNV